jgi:hypothetical protein
LASNLRRSKRTIGRRLSYIETKLNVSRRANVPRRLAPGAVSGSSLSPEVNSTIDGIQATADGKNSIYRQSSAPSGSDYVEGDLWFDTANGNRFSRWSTPPGGGALQWVAFSLGNNALAEISATKITAGSLGASVIVTSNLDAGQITAGAISSIEIRSGSPVGGLYPFRVDTAGNMRATSATITGTITGSTITGGTVTSGTFDGDPSSVGLRMEGGYIQASGGGVKIKDFAGGTGNTQLFSNIIFTGTLDAEYIRLLDGTSSIELFQSFANFKRYTDDTGAALNIYRRSWTTGAALGDSRSDNAALIAFYKEGAGSSFAAMRYVAGADPGSVQLQNISDSRLKTEVIGEVTALAIIDSLKPKHFRWVNQKSGDINYGLYAQELHDVLPSAVYVGDSAESATINQDTGEHEVEDAWMMDYTPIIPYLIGAVKELSAKVAELEAK